MVDIQKALDISGAGSILMQPVIDKVDKTASYGSDTILSHSYIGGSPFNHSDLDG